jgi:hypothetical protein
MPTNLSEETVLKGFAESPLIKGILAKKTLDEFKEQNRTKAFVKISQFLTDSPEFLTALNKLEEEMTTEFKRCVQGSKDEDQAAIDLAAVGTKAGMFAHRRANKYQSVAHDPTRHLLTQILNKALEDEGFTSFERNADGLIFGPSAYGNIEHAFGEQIQQGRIVKDYVGLDHGEYTHMIQWYCVIKQKIFLTLPTLGYDKVVNLFKVSGIFWGPVFDLNQALGEDDFRKPEKLYPWLCEPMRVQNYPLLNGFLVSRRLRLSETAYSPARMKLILAKKFGGLAPPNGYLQMTTPQCDIEFEKNSQTVRDQVVLFMKLDKENRNNKVLGGNWQALPKVVKV